MIGFLFMCSVEKTNFQYWMILFPFYSILLFPSQNVKIQKSHVSSRKNFDDLLCWRKYLFFFSQENVSLSIFCKSFNLYKITTDWNYEKLIGFVPWLFGGIVCMEWEWQKRKFKKKKSRFELWFHSVQF